MRTVSKIFLFITAIFIITACGGVKDKYTKLVPENGKLQIPINEVSDGQAHYYKVTSGGKEIKFFLLKSSDGIIRAAFDACDVCYLEKKGYSQDGQFMICNNCGQRFHSSKINIVKGGCNPSPLNRKPTDSNIEITMKDIASGHKYF